MRSSLIAAACAAVALLALAPAANAAFVQVEGDALKVIAGPGETNVLTLHLDPFAGVADVSDTGSPDTMAAGPRCAPTGAPGAVSCESAGVARIEVYLGDGDDQATLQTIVPARLNGGDGNDVLYGGLGDDSLESGPGDDYASGDAGNSRSTPRLW